MRAARYLGVDFRSLLDDNAVFVEMALTAESAEADAEKTLNERARKRR